MELSTIPKEFGADGLTNALYKGKELITRDRRNFRLYFGPTIFANVLFNTEIMVTQSCSMSFKCKYHVKLSIDSKVSQKFKYFSG